MPEDRSDAPAEFLTALAPLRQMSIPPALTLREIPARGAVAPFSAALSGEIKRSRRNPEMLAHGNLSVLYSPSLVPEWESRFRIAAIVRADIDHDMGRDPLLQQVARSWIDESLETTGALYSALRGTVTIVVSEKFEEQGTGDLDTQLEIRMSWSPQPSGVQTVDWHLERHVESWMNLLFATSGSPMLFIH
ncbi:DUF3000 family protein [Jonesia quinghaiensis]|uniref:DUF3000 family protein n=1 Tax=Jonesia quinghaiensis TaxID=262806 RepID=UPI00040B0A99|nr:DUF3000 family protein [Jonesia quinghaiensis]